MIQYEDPAERICEICDDSGARYRPNELRICQDCWDAVRPENVSRETMEHQWGATLNTVVAVAVMFWAVAFLGFLLAIR
jgi:hypothetical protein